MRSPILRFFDRRDDRKALAWRARLGPAGWLVSWYRVDGPSARNEPWLARVSCRDWPQTVERRGPCRSRAIAEAVAALEELIRGDDVETASSEVS